MKKILIGLFVMAFAISAQAAATNWHYDNWFADVNGDPVAGALSFFLDDTAIGSITIDGDGHAEGNVTIDNGTLKIVTEITNFADGSGKSEWTYVISSIPLPGYPDPQSSLIALAQEHQLDVLINGDLDLTMSAADNGYSPVGPTPPIIPEPTTGLLVLIGVAGLALRRRRA